LGPFHTNNPHHVGCAIGFTAPCPGNEVSNQYFDPNQFADAPLGQFGSAKRTICCGPGLNNTDLSIQKTTPLGENNRLEFRWDIFNVANHPKFFNPDGNITDGSDFGHILQAGPPRLMQFALKFYF